MTILGTLSLKKTKKVVNSKFDATPDTSSLHLCAATPRLGITAQDLNVLLFFERVSNGVKSL